MCLIRDFSVYKKDYPIFDYFTFPPSEGDSLFISVIYNKKKGYIQLNSLDLDSIKTLIKDNPHEILDYPAYLFDYFDIDFFEYLEYYGLYMNDGRVLKQACKYYLNKTQDYNGLICALAKNNDIDFYYLLNVDEDEDENLLKDHFFDGYGDDNDSILMLAIKNNNSNMFKDLMRYYYFDIHSLEEQKKIIEHKNKNSKTIFDYLQTDNQEFDGEEICSLKDYDFLCQDKFYKQLYSLKNISSEEIHYNNYNAKAYLVKDTTVITPFDLNITFPRGSTIYIIGKYFSYDDYYNPIKDPEFIYYIVENEKHIKGIISSVNIYSNKFDIDYDVDDDNFIYNQDSSFVNKNTKEVNFYRYDKKNNLQAINEAELKGDECKFISHGKRFNNDKMYYALELQWGYFDKDYIVKNIQYVLYDADENKAYEVFRVDCEKDILDSEFSSFYPETTWNYDEITLRGSERYKRNGSYQTKEHNYSIHASNFFYYYTNDYKSSQRD